MPWYRRVSEPTRITVVGAVAVVGIVLYVYGVATEPPVVVAWAARLFPLRLLPGDLAAYLNRFALSALLLGVLPLTAAAALGFSPRRLGLTVGRGFWRSRLFWAALVVVPTLAGISAGRADIAGFYPYSATIIQWSRTETGWWFVLHTVAYLVCYYLPWELCFRGVLFLLFVPAIDGEPPAAVPATVMVAAVSAQVIASTLTHFGHPLSETLGAIVFGYLAAAIAVRSRSVLPVVLIHWLAGVAVDLVIMLSVPV